MEGEEKIRESTSIPRVVWSPPNLSAICPVVDGVTNNHRWWRRGCWSYRHWTSVRGHRLMEFIGQTGLLNRKLRTQVSNTYISPHLYVSVNISS